MRDSQLECQLTCLAFSISPACICDPEMSLHIMPIDFQEREMKEKHPNELQKPFYKWVINFWYKFPNALPGAGDHSVSHYILTGCFSKPITHIQMRQFTCLLKLSISVAFKGMLQRRLDYFWQRFANEAIHISPCRFKLPSTWTMLTQALSCWP